MIFPSKIHNSVTDAIKKTELLRKINPYDALDRIKTVKTKKLYKWRKWDWKRKMYIPVYKPFPPKNPFKLRNYENDKT